MKNSGYFVRSFFVLISGIQTLLRNKLDKAGDIILCANKAKNVDIAVALARLFQRS